MQQAKHLYSRMAEWYSAGAVTARLLDLEIDHSLQKMLDQMYIEHTANIFFDITHSEQILSGSHGREIMELRNNGLPTIYSSREMLNTAIRRGELTLHGTHHGYCRNGYNCDMDSVVNPASCVDCKSNGSIITSEQAKWWQAQHNKLVSFLNGSEFSKSIYSHCITQIRAAEKVMSDFSLQFVPYKSPIEITI